MTFFKATSINELTKEQSLDLFCFKIQMADKTFLNDIKAGSLDVAKLTKIQIPWVSYHNRASLELSCMLLCSGI